MLSVFQFVPKLCTSTSTILFSVFQFVTRAMRIILFPVFQFVTRAVRVILFCVFQFVTRAVRVSLDFFCISVCDWSCMCQLVYFSFATGAVRVNLNILFSVFQFVTRALHVNLSIFSVFQFVTRAVRVIDLITNLDMHAFQSHGGLTAFIRRLEVCGVRLVNFG